MNKMQATIKRTILGLSVALAAPATVGAGEIAGLETQFRELPMEARRLTGPLFWMHGDDNETQERLEGYLEKVAEGGNGCFTAESRPHSDWLGPRWYRGPRHLPAEGQGPRSQDVDLRRTLVAQPVDRRQGPAALRRQVAGRRGGGRRRGRSCSRPTATAASATSPRWRDASTRRRKSRATACVDLAPFIKDGKLGWKAPAGNWQVIRFTHQQAPGLGQRGGKELSIDGASRDCTDWFLQTVYQPHYDHFKDDFGKTIPGFFYDEPETKGDWGTELDVILKEWGVDWKKAYVAYKFKLAGDDDLAARYQYMEAIAEAWGRVMYGGMSKWCREHEVVSIGHFMEHGNLYLRPDYCAGDMMRLQKYSDMGGIDLVVPADVSRPAAARHLPDPQARQLHLARLRQEGRPRHVRDLRRLQPGPHLSADEVADRPAPGPRHQLHDPALVQPEGAERPRLPAVFLQRRPRTALAALPRLGRLHEPPEPDADRRPARLPGGHPVQRQRASASASYVTPEDMTTVLQDALYDCDWLPFEAFESDAALDGQRHQAPPGALPGPGRAADRGHPPPHAGQGEGLLRPGRRGARLRSPAVEIRHGRHALRRDRETPRRHLGKRSQAGHRRPARPTPPAAARISCRRNRTSPRSPPPFTGMPASRPSSRSSTARPTTGCTSCTGSRTAATSSSSATRTTRTAAKTFRLKLTADGFPEIWDAMRNEISSVAFTRSGGSVEFKLTLEPMESVLVVFNPEQRDLPARVTAEAIQSAGHIAVTGSASRSRRRQARRPGDGQPGRRQPVLGNLPAAGRRGPRHGTGLPRNGRTDPGRGGPRDHQRQRCRRLHRQTVPARRDPPPQARREHDPDRTLRAEVGAAGGHPRGIDEVNRRGESANKKTRS